jgi:predicted nucleic acid-binding protein
MQWTSFESGDWDRAAQLWAEARTKGRQLSDVDLLIADIAIRLDAILVTADDDFGALPVRRENWRG